MFISTRSSKKCTPMNIHAQANVAVRQPYAHFDQLPIGGEWRRGKMRAVKNYDPYTGEIILEIPQGDRNDLNDAYAAATRAQNAWACPWTARDVQGPWS
jgi:Aldehyde dehydrogenase family